MGDPGPAMKKGVKGILQREQEMRDALKKPLTPTEMWHQVVQSQRGFTSSPSGAADAMRKQPAKIPAGAQAGDKGVNVGKGYETVGAVQVIDKNGQRAAIASDIFTGGGVDDHAEAKAIRGLEKSGPAAAPDSRIVVVVETDCCASCEARLKAYAQKIGAKEIEIHVPERMSLTKPGVAVTPKTASTTSLKNTGVPTTIKKLRTIGIARPGSAGRSGAPHAPVVRARTAVMGSMANLAAGLALGILQQAMKDQMLKSLENLPKPKIDKRSAEVYFSDPNTAKSLKLIDLLGKHLQPLGQQLQEHHAKVIAGTNLEIAGLAISSLTVDERLEFLYTLQTQHDIYGRQLYTVLDNLEAAQAASGKALESARNAEELAKVTEISADWLFKNGFSVEEIASISESFHGYSSRVRTTFSQVDTLRARVQKMLDEQSAQAASLSTLSWSITWGNIAEELKKKGITP